MAKSSKSKKKKFSIISNSPEETISVGKKFAKILKPGNVVFLTGGLGSGKTTFIKGIAKGLKIKSEPTSPSFTLVKEYPEKNFFHIDLYRITQKEFLQAGLENYFIEENICAVEWSEKLKLMWSQLRKSSRCIFVNIQMLKDDKRKLTFYSSL
ncbi:MAG: tRNA (adenosine(37)-N6)-threonylcarbamoyltransferase complex ATPase subunit type 1 TsaE [Elusimicrobiota bacterium]|nr:tRNA (adenosine(37)-N6)-threonylcarbamoyltransferase complex ATPase subunit type 1 TsaE [Elusimicrobiota bacterium]